MAKTSPPEKVRVRLEDARRRGWGWARAWEHATVGLAWNGGREKADWLPVILETEDAWRVAYLREPAPGLDAVGVLAEDLDGLMAA